MNDPSWFRGMNSPSWWPSADCPADVPLLCFALLFRTLKCPARRKPVFDGTVVVQGGAVCRGWGRAMNDLSWFRGMNSPSWWLSADRPPDVLLLRFARCWVPGNEFPGPWPVGRSSCGRVEASGQVIHSSGWLEGGWLLTGTPDGTVWTGRSHVSINVAMTSSILPSGLVGSGS